jgi:uncharacterized integral membrane protein
MDFFAWLGRFVFFLLMLVLALENNITVPLRVTATLHWQDVPLMIIILICFVAGVLAGTLALLPRLVRLSRAAGREQVRNESVMTQAVAELALTRAARQGAVAELEPEARRR